MKIGLALSGGGVRATIYHLGVLARLAESELWGQIRHVSTVSGGSLCAALVFAKNQKRWPDGPTYLNAVLPAIQKLLTTQDLQKAYIIRALRPWLLLRGRAHVLAAAMESVWGINGCVSEMPLEPRWTINATCYETGKNWRFSAKRMGDYITEYVLQPKFPLAAAAAASAAVPGAIGPLTIDAAKYTWHSVDKKGLPTGEINPAFSTYHLWDGGVYENQGLEVLYKAGQGYRYDLDFCLVSDASAPVGSEARTDLPVLRHFLPMKRLIFIAMDQIRSLRARDVFGYMKGNRCGGYLRMGESVAAIYRANGVALPEENLEVLSDNDVAWAAGFPTTLRQVTKAEFTLLFRHGYETCSAVLAVSSANPFQAFNASILQTELTNRDEIPAQKRGE